MTDSIFHKLDISLTPQFAEVITYTNSQPTDHVWQAMMGIGVHVTIHPVSTSPSPTVWIHPRDACWWNMRDMWVGLPGSILTFNLPVKVAPLIYNTGLHPSSFFFQTAKNLWQLDLQQMHDSVRSYSLSARLHIDFNFNYTNTVSSKSHTCKATTTTLKINTSLYS